MSECKDCNGKEEEKMMPSITINVTYNDYRVLKDSSTYVDNLTMDSEE